MAKLAMPRCWLEEVEDLEERLETLKRSLLPLPLPWRELSRQKSIVRSTAGLLAHQAPNGKVYERRLRLAWEREFRRRAG